MTSFRLSMAMPSGSLRAGVHERMKGETPAETRKRVLCMIEGLILVLDELDGEANAEDDGTAEPSLGWSATMAHGSGDDREEDAAPVSGPPANVVRLVPSGSF